MNRERNFSLTGWKYARHKGVKYIQRKYKKPYIFGIRDTSITAASILLHSLNLNMPVRLWGTSAVSWYNRRMHQ